MEWFFNLTVVEQTLIATAFTYLLTALGASLVFFCKKIDDNAYAFLTAFAGGIMLASSFFSLLVPAMDSVQEGEWLTLSLGFFTGALTIIFIEWLSNKWQYGGDKKSKSNFITCTAVAVHNVPEGMAIGIAFGAGQGVGALMLAIGIAIQNLPEGACVSFPLRTSGMGRTKSFLIGQFSGMLEIFAGLVGVLAVSIASAVLPFALCFSAGAMITVVCSTLMPDSYSANRSIADIGTILGFVIMMILDLALG